MKKGLLYKLLLSFFMLISVFSETEKTHAAETRATYVARIDSYYYTTLEEALNVAEYFGGGGTIYVLNNTTIDTYFLDYITSPLTIMPEGGNWTISYQDKDGDSTNGNLDSNGYADGHLLSIKNTCTAAVTISGNGNYTLTFDGTPPSNISTNDVRGYPALDNILHTESNTILNIKSGVVIKNATSSLWSCGVKINGIGNISGGDFWGNGISVAPMSGSTVNISGGSFQGIWGVYNQGSSNVNISDGSFYNNAVCAVQNGDMFSSGNIINISGGNYYYNNCGLSNYGTSTLNITNCNIHTNTTHGIENYGTLNMSLNTTVNFNNDIYLASGTYINVTGALNKSSVGVITPETYTLFTNLVKVSYSGGSGSSVLDKFSVNSSDGSYCLLASGQYLVLSRNYTVSYRANGGSGSTANNTATYNVAFLTTKNGYTRTGYTFAGWNEKTDGSGTAWTLNSAGVYESGKSWTWTYTYGITLYAQWTHNKYTVTYNANGGTTSASAKKYYYNDAVDLSPLAEKEGKIFVGWSTDPNATRPLTSLSMPDLATSENTDYTSDWELTLYAVYSIPVSDVANHTYPDYAQVKADEVYLLVWENGDFSNFRTYPLVYTIDTNTMVYKYKLDTTEISSFVSGIDKYCYQIIAYDNAGNYGVLYEGTSANQNEEPEDFPIPETYLQTVNHYRYDAVIKDWIKFDTTTEIVLEGETFSPSYITSPSGYKTDSIDSAYIVSGTQTSNAYYRPIDYTLTFDANGGECSVEQKIISYGDYYGEMPTPTRKGHTFIGWYTEKNGGTVAVSSDRYLTAGNTTLYAHWEINSYMATYDYWTNGGTSVAIAEKSYDYGSKVDLSITAAKNGTGLNGWRFVGWNTNPDATEGLTSFTMSDKDEVLYAIYKKDIAVSLFEKTDTGQVSRTLTKTIYNNAKEADFSIFSVDKWTGWTLLGWTTETGATEPPMVGVDGVYITSDSTTLYALYTAQVTLSYDTNGSSMEIDVQTKDCYYNASGESSYPLFEIANAPILSHHSFVEWVDVNGNSYGTGENVVFTNDTILTASWDQYPEIEAYDRYFTLEQAKNGEITEEELLKQVVGTDKEDGTLINGTSVIMKDYNLYDFTSITTDENVKITYQATDSFGNTVTKIVTITVTDTSARKSTKKSYVRFISSQFFKDNAGNMVSASQGGLEENSVWRINENYTSLLSNVLSNSKTNVETKIVSAFGSQWEVEVAGSGEWNKKEEVWIFKTEDIQKMKSYTNTYGYILNALDKFFELFYGCKQE